MLIGSTIRQAITMRTRGSIIRSGSNCQSRLRNAGLVLGLIGAISFTVTTFIQVVFVSGGWYGELSVFMLSANLILLVTLAIAWKWELIGGPMLIIGALVMEGLPYMRGASLMEATLLTKLLYPLFGVVLLASGTFLIHSWRENQILSPQKRQKDLHRAGFVIGLITVILLVPTYLSGAFSLAMGEQSDLALLLLVLLLLALMGAGISWKWPLAGGAMFTLLGIVGLLVVFVINPTFIWWGLPQLANLPIVSLLPLTSGTLCLLSWREDVHINSNYRESTKKLSELASKDIVARWNS